MEGQQNTQQLVLVSTLIILFFVILFILFIIDQRRKVHSKDAIIDLLEKGNRKEIDTMKEDIEELKKSIKGRDD